MAFSWQNFLNNWRTLSEAAQKNVEGGVETALSTPPTSVVQPLWKMAGQEAPTTKKPYKQVYGFEQDKANYGDERSYDKLEWRDFTAHDNDTGKDFKFSVGYDQDGRISGARANDRSYYGKDLVSSFFKNNFDRDATDYTIFTDPHSWDDELYGYMGAVFDSQKDGEFIPSYAFDRRRGADYLPYSGDGDFGKLSEELRKQRFRSNTVENTLFTDEPKTAEPAYNSTYFVNDFTSTPLSAEDAQTFTSGAKDFTDMLLQYSTTNDANARRQILQNAYRNFGSNSRFRMMLEYMAGGEEESGGEPNDFYDYRKVFEQVGPDVAAIYKLLNPRT